MSSLATQHPEEGMLLRYIDGELPGRKGRQVESHLKACWQCRTEVEELEGTVAECVRYRKHVLQTYLPDPPNPWPDLYREFARLDSSASGESHSVVKRLAARFRGTGQRATVRRWAFGAVAALVMVCAVWYQFREAPPVQAAALLKRAVLAADAQAAPARRVIQMRTRTQKVSRTLGKGQKTATPAAWTEMEARLTAARFDAADPLSARAYRAWRERVPSTHEEVVTTADAYRIRTVAAEGEVAAASLVLRATDLRPMEERLEFRDQDWVEFSDITDATTRDDGAPVATNVELPARRDVPSHPAVTSSGQASISDELRVLAALHEIGADLGDPVEVKRAEGQITVGGIGISPERQRQIRARLDGTPHVRIDFSEPAPGGAAGEPAAADLAGAGVPPAAFQSRVEKQLGGHAEFEKFSTQILDRNEALMSRAYALRRLAERFPRAAEEAMEAKDREILHDMARQHLAVLASEAAGIERVLKPVLAGMGADSGARTAAQKTWQGGLEEMFQASRRVEVLVSVLLGATPGSAATEKLPAELLTALAELRADAESCQRLLAP